MPLVSIPTGTLRRLVGRRLEREELVTALEQLGCDVEGHATVTLYRCGRCGHITEILEHEDFNNACPACASPDIAPAASHEVVRISLLPVRPDMFDAAGLARAVRGYLGIETGLPVYRLARSGLTVRVQPGLEDIRPHIAACVVRGLALDEETLKALMKMQENLHWAMGRDRRRASIGVYDLDAVEPDFVYAATAPDGVEFVPLGGMPEGRVAVTPRDILSRHPKGVAYAHLLADRGQWPLLTDSRGRVLSLPPIINSEDTRVATGTRGLFVDVTGPDRHAVTRTIAVFACALSDLGGQVETVRVVRPDGTEEETPDLQPRKMTLDPAAAEKLLGTAVPDMAAGLERMRYGVRPAAGQLEIMVPAYRADIMHNRDLYEDVAIGHGYHNVEPRLVPGMTVGAHLPTEELSTTARRVMTGLGFMETMTLALIGERDGYELLGLPVPERGVRIANPLSVEQTMAREQLIPGLLATFRLNTTRRMPQYIFEAGDSYQLDDRCETGVRTERRLGAGMTGPEVGFADVRRVVEALARELGLEPGGAGAHAVHFRATEHPVFIPGRCAHIMVTRADRESAGAGPEQFAEDCVPGRFAEDCVPGRFAEDCVPGRFTWGLVGEIHPQVLERFGISQPTAVFELNLSMVLEEV